MAVTGDLGGGRERFSRFAGAPCSRRGLLAGASGVAVASLAIAGCSPKSESGPALDAKQLQIVQKLADLLIPRTDTPGAVEAGCVAFVAEQVTRLADDKRGPFTNGLGQIGKFLGSSSKAGWADIQKAAEQAGAEATGALKAVRGWTLLGYYSSEPGATQELRYELVPGRFDPDVPVTAETRSYSSDWFGVALGGRG
jgi:hypothetical protein